MHSRLKKIIFNKLYEYLKNAEIIHFENSIWFIDREKKYWYLQYRKSGLLLWRYQFFNNFFLLFSMDRSKYERVIVEWVEEVLNCKGKHNDKVYDTPRPEGGRGVKFKGKHNQRSFPIPTV